MPSARIAAMLRAPDVDLVSDALRDADPAALCTDADLARMARAVLRVLQAPQAVSYPSPTCPGCSRTKRFFPHKSTRAVLLDVDGLRRVRHVPRRCQANGCPLKGMLLWANFEAKNKVHAWRWYERALPETVMLTPRFGVTAAWYKQFTKRVLCQYATFWGEARVHALAGKGWPSLGRLKKLITKAWFTLRWLERSWSRGCGLSVQISDTPEQMIAPHFSSYYVAMRRRRAACAAALGLPTHMQVIDGHQKLTRRACCARRVLTLPHEGLGLMAICDCAQTPAYKDVLCPAHRRRASNMHGQPTAQRLHWKAPVGKTLADMVDVWVGDSAASARRLPCTPDLHGAFLAFQTQVSLDVHGARLAEGSTPKQDHGLEDLPDDMTLFQLSSLTCATHKMGARSAREVPDARGPRKRRALCRRTGGFLVAVTPEGFVTDAFEFTGTESCAQRYLFLARLRELYPDLDVVCHDDACHLRRFAQRFAGNGGLAEKLSYPRMRYVLDRFHASAHTDPWCKENVHPGTPENVALLGDRNTSACEILFHWLARYKHSFRHMGRWTANMFVQELLDLHNEDVFPTTTCPAVASQSSSSSSSSSPPGDSSEGSGDM